LDFAFSWSVKVAAIHDPDVFAVLERQATFVM
jgi:hypothetical protein